jgi:hypothetical protein
MREYIISSGSERFYLCTIHISTDKQISHHKILFSLASKSIRDISRDTFRIMLRFARKGRSKPKKTSSNDNPTVNANSTANCTVNQPTNRSASESKTENNPCMSGYSNMGGPDGHKGIVNTSRNKAAGGTGSSRQPVAASCLACYYQNILCDGRYPTCGPCLRGNYACLR